MTFRIPLNHKFGCVALSRASVDRGLEESLEFSPGLLTVFGSPFEVDQTWREWLGSLRSEVVSECNLALLALAPSATLDVLDGENQTLELKALAAFYSLLLAKFFHYDDAILISGAMIDRREHPLSIRSVSNLDTHYRPQGALIETIGPRDLLALAPVVHGMLSTFVAGEEPSRLARGFHAFMRGMREMYGADRLHQFVRALEALVRPDIGRSTSLFAHRCQLFAGNSSSATELLLELYNLRGNVEHMNPLDSGLEKYAESERFDVGLERSFQAQVLASRVYRKIFGDPDLRALFSSDSSIDTFWKRPWMDQVAIWGAHVDLVAISQQQFRRDLLVRGVPMRKRSTSAPRRAPVQHRP